MSVRGGSEMCADPVDCFGLCLGRHLEALWTCRPFQLYKPSRESSVMTGFAQVSVPVGEAVNKVCIRGFIMGARLCNVAPGA
jgi:hypothetical protein